MNLLCNLALRCFGSLNRRLCMTVIMLGRHAFPQLSRVLQSVTRFTSTAAKITDLAGTASQTATPSVIAQQAPNYPTTWTTSQQPRPAVGSSPRFEQTAMEFQPNPLSAMELVSREPVRLVDGRRAVCDGGGL